MADEKLVIGADGKAAKVPLSTADITQRAVDEAEHERRKALPPPTKADKVAAMLAQHGLTIADLNAELAKLPKR